MSWQLPRLALTSGDPAGIGPELVLKTVSAFDAGNEKWLPVIYGNANLLKRVAAATGLPWPLSGLTVIPPDVPCNEWPQTAVLLDFPFDAAASLIPGKVQAACGRQAYIWIEAAAQDALAGKVAGIVTAPLNKAALHLAGVPFPGHTEILADITGVTEAHMMFWSEQLVVTLVTIHEPIAKVPQLLSAEKVLAAIRATAKAVQASGKAAVYIGVLALNPHAGEDGLFGNEEFKYIAPAIAEARKEGLNVSGPLVPDTAFCFLNEQCATQTGSQCDAFVAMYHDQGLMPFKMVAFDQGVNVTLGLPIVRTSPDHGTAFDLAWQGVASDASFKAAVQLALKLAAGRS